MKEEGGGLEERRTEERKGCREMDVDVELLGDVRN